MWVCVATRCDFVVDATSSILMPPGRGPDPGAALFYAQQRQCIRCAARACCQMFVDKTRRLLPAVRATGRLRSRRWASAVNRLSSVL